MIASYALSVWLVGYLAWGRDSPPGTGSVWLLAGVAYVGTLVALAVVWALLLNVSPLALLWMYAQLGHCA
jgi:hypothetical protein